MLRLLAHVLLKATAFGPCLVTATAFGKCLGKATGLRLCKKMLFASYTECKNHVPEFSKDSPSKLIPFLVLDCW